MGLASVGIIVAPRFPHDPHRHTAPISPQSKVLIKGFGEFRCLQDELFIVCSLATLLCSPDPKAPNSAISATAGSRVHGWAPNCLPNDPSKSSQVGVGIGLQSRWRMHRIPLKEMWHATNDLPCEIEFDDQFLKNHQYRCDREYNLSKGEEEKVVVGKRHRTHTVHTAVISETES